MGILSWIVFGLLAGALAKFLMPGPDRLGCFGTLLIGILGAVVGGFIGTQMGWGTIQSFDIRSVGLAVLGGVVVLFVRRMLMSR